MARVSDKAPEQAVYAPSEVEGAVEPGDDVAPDETVADELARDEVRASDGRVFKIKETFAAHDNRVDSFLLRQGVGNNFQGVGISIYMRYCAIMALISIDGTPFAWPKSVAAIDALMGTIRGKDMLKIVQKYVEVNGLDGEQTDEGDFRPE